MGESLPVACQDWANTKAAWRFFANDRISEAEILAGLIRGAITAFIIDRRFDRAAISAGAVLPPL